MLKKASKKSVLFAIAFSLFISYLITSLYLPEKKFVSPLSRDISITNPSYNRNKFLVYGFLPYWKLSKSKYIQTDKLTDIAYFSLIINSNGSIRKTTSDGFIEPGYNNYLNNKDLKKLTQNKNLNFAVTVISHENDVIENFLYCRDCWNRLRDELFELMSIYEIKHLNLDFEYVSENTPKELSLKYSELAKFINNELKAIYPESTTTVSAFADSMKKQRITDIRSLQNSVDYIFIMAYDFNTIYSKNAGSGAPIGSNDNIQSYNLSKMMNDYKKIPNISSKLILGIPFYGYNWIVEDTRLNASRVEGNNNIGFSVIQTYEDVMNLIIKYNPKIEWDEISKTPYFNYYNIEKGVYRQVHFENERSLKEKIKFAKENNLAGIGIWALGYDGGYQELWNVLQEINE